MREPTDDYIRLLVLQMDAAVFAADAAVSEEALRVCEMTEPDQDFDRLVAIW